MYAEDARLLPNNSEIVDGRDAIKMYWEKALLHVGHLTVTAMDVQNLAMHTAAVLRNAAH
jgi:ketosteroid isomerase-like protein